MYLRLHTLFRLKKRSLLTCLSQRSLTMMCGWAGLCSGLIQLLERENCPMLTAKMEPLRSMADLWTMERSMDQGI